MEQFIRVAVVAACLWASPPQLMAQNPDIEAMKRSLEAQIGVFQRVNELEARVTKLEQKGGDPNAVVVTPPAQDAPPAGSGVELTSTPESLAQSPTSHEAIQFALSMYRGVLPQHTFVDIGCGDGRVLIAAVRKFGCKGLGIEVDPDKAALARRCVEAAGLSDRIEIREGDATQMEFKADAGFAYLYPETLEALKEKIAQIPAFVSYQHEADGLKETVHATGKFYSKEPLREVQVVDGQRYADWGGRRYYVEYNRNCNCAMCQSIRGQLAIPRTTTVAEQQASVQPVRRGHWQRQCINGVCRMVWVDG